MKIAAISDLHGNIPNGYYSEVELLIISGDLPSSDEVNSQRDWFLNIFKNNIWKPFPDLQEIIIVPGNHDYWLEKNYELDSNIKEFLGNNITILVDRCKKFISFSTGEEITIYGNPRTSLDMFAFPHLYKKSDILNIPEKIDILVTHEAPRLNELECIQKVRYDGELPGDVDLADKVTNVKPKYHIFGHIHYPCKSVINGTVFLNASQFKFKKYINNVNILDI